MFDPRLALASLSGESDADWARQGCDWAGAALLGGICIDEPSREAARRMVADRDRDEFLPPDPLAFVDRQLAALEAVPIRAGFNVRSTTPEPVREAGRIAARHGAILEVNAHCRQDELCGVGCGEALLANTERLAAFVAAAVEGGAETEGELDVSVKVRAEVPGVDLAETARAVQAAGADCIHVDAMDSEAVVADVADEADLFVVANNGVRDRETVREYLEHGADAVSVGRPSDDPRILSRVREAVDESFAESGSESESESESESDSREARS